MKLLAVDIGNTNINFGVFEKNKLAGKFMIPTRGYQLKELKKKTGKLEPDEIIISSVVPGACNILGRDLKSLFSRAPYVLGKNIAVPVKNLYRHPKQVGQDRLVDAYAGVTLYGAPLIVVDFGTAVTFDIISKKKEYLGGMILPGLGISLEGLYENTALLPKIKLKKPMEFIGRDTQASMLSGAVYGFASLVDGLTEKIKEKIGRGALVVGTGGDINLVGRYCKRIDKIDGDLTLKGLNLIMRQSKKILKHFPT